MCLRMAGPRHQPRRQATAGCRDRPCRPLRTALPGSTSRIAAPKLRRRVFHVDDLIKPRIGMILLVRLSSFPWPHDPVSAALVSRTGNHAFRFEGIAKSNLQEKRASDPKTRQNALLRQVQSSKPIKGFEKLHGRLTRECRLKRADKAKGKPGLGPGYKLGVQHVVVHGER